MDNLSLILIEFISALLCFVLLRFMVKPYSTTGERRYLGLPLGFGFLGISYLFMSAILYFTRPPIFVLDIEWFQLFTEAYAFAFLAVTYYFSKKPTKKTPLLWDITYAALIFTVIIAYLIVVEQPHFGLPTYKTSAEFFMLFNIACLVYITVHTLRNHVSNFNAQTILIPFAYLLLGFSQYSLLIWSIDTSFAAHVGGYFLRLASLIIFLFVTYRAFHASREKPQEKGILNEKTATTR